MSRVPWSLVRAALASLVLTGALGAGVAFAGTDVGSVNFILGRTSLTNEWNPGPPTVDATQRVGQPTLGVELTWGRQGWPVLIALDVLHSYDDGIIHVPAFTDPAFDVRIRARVLEIGLGARRAWDVLGWSPFVGAGGSWVRGSLAVEISDPNAAPFGTPLASARGHSSAFGYWAGGGIYRRLGPRFQLGLAARYSKATLPEADLILDDSPPALPLDRIPELEGGGRRINLVVGWSFPSRK